ncbi:MAG: hypothetical protein LQ342_002718 [Letrouitia transgressa]|nr:MAG: hypothetical protein LQ342_002718 [Letrouitia transgressa]
MPPALYFSLRDHYLTELSTFFVHVETPLEAPEKDSYGDLDFIASSPLPCYSREALSQSINASRSVSNAGTLSFAVPYPDLEDSFVQLDLHICPEERFKWTLFHQSHGDLWNILGPSMRVVGLVVNDKGLYLRIPEIEGLNRKKGQLHLTSDPNEVLDFLDLDEERYQQRFETRNALFEYACGMRFFQPKAYVRETLTTSDRKKTSKRDQCKKFFNEFLPSIQEEKGEEWRDLNIEREHVSDEALQRFGKSNDLENRLMQWRQGIEEQKRKREIYGKKKQQQDTENGASAT